jgi:acyl carrier protein
VSDEELLSNLAEIVNEVTGTPTEKVVPEASFGDDLDIDSLSMVEVIVAAEEKFNVRIPDDDAAKLSTVGDAVDYIKKAGASA